MRKLSVRAGVALVALAIVTIRITPALAHEHREVDGIGTTVGWVEEPAFAGFRNAVQFVAAKPGTTTPSHTGDDNHVDETPVDASPIGQTLTVDRFEGQPTLYGITLQDGRALQLYFDPERPGRSAFHATFFDAAGSEFPIESVRILMRRPAASADVLSARRFGPGHFVADVELEQGDWIYDLIAQTAADERLRFVTKVEVE